jgi:hypothetical protein
MKILADVDETHDAFPVYDNRRRVRHSVFDRLCCVVPDTKASNEVATSVDRKENLISHVAFVDESARSIIELLFGQDPDNFEVLIAFEGLPQLNEPRFCEGSPVDAAFEDQQQFVAEQIRRPDRFSVDVDEVETRQFVADFAELARMISARFCFRAAATD